MKECVLDYDCWNSTVVKISFICPKCSSSLESNDLEVPVPNYSSETARDSEELNNDQITCYNCYAEYDIQIVKGYSGGFITVSNLLSNYPIEVTQVESINYDSDELKAILSNTQFYQTFQNEISNIEALNDIIYDSSVSIEENSNKEGHYLHGELEDTFRNLLFINIITCLETFLSSAFINTVISDSNHLRRFVENFDDFKKSKFNLSELFKKQIEIKDLAKTEMYKLLYHNLSVIAPIYRDCLGIKFQDFSEIARAIVKRHDLVHRNGRNKEDETKIKIVKTDVVVLVKLVKSFVYDIESQIKNLETTL